MYSLGRRVGGLLMHQSRGYFFKTCHKAQRISTATGTRSREPYQREEKECITRRGKREEERLSQMLGES